MCKVFTKWLVHSWNPLPRKHTRHQGYKSLKNDSQRWYVSKMQEIHENSPTLCILLHLKWSFKTARRITFKSILQPIKISCTIWQGSNIQRIIGQIKLRTFVDIFVTPFEMMHLPEAKVSKFPKRHPQDITQALVKYSQYKSTGQSQISRINSFRN